MISATVAKQSDVDGLWPLISEDIIKCIEKTPTFLTASDLWVMCRSGEGFLIVVHDEDKILGAAVWRFEKDSFVCLIVTGTKADEWWGIFSATVSEVARLGGARQLMFTGRAGLFKKLKKHFPAMRMTRVTATMRI